MKLYKIKTVENKGTAIYNSYNVLEESMEEALEKWKSQPVEEGMNIKENPEEIEMIAEVSFL